MEQLLNLSINKLHRTLLCSVFVGNPFYLDGNRIQGDILMIGISAIQ